MLLQNPPHQPQPGEFPGNPCHPIRTSLIILSDFSPAIIIFDSLKLKHAPTIKALKDYLVEEAKVKRDMDISKEDIVGMHAKVQSLMTGLTAGSGTE